MVLQGVHAVGRMRGHGQQYENRRHHRPENHERRPCAMAFVIGVIGAIGFRRERGTSVVPRRRSYSMCGEYERGSLIKLKSEYGCERITIQTGGTLNNLFLREKLFDYVDIIIAPVLIGGKDTSTLIDGKSLTEECELSKLGVVKLQECVVLENSYLRLRYEVIH